MVQCNDAANTFPAIASNTRLATYCLRNIENLKKCMGKFDWKYRESSTIGVTILTELTFI